MEHFINNPNLSKASRIFRIILMVIGGVILAGLFALLFGYLIMWLWNWLMPELFGLSIINYWQAVGLFFLFKILTGGFHPFHSKDSEKSKFKKWHKKANSNSGFGESDDWQKFWEEKCKDSYSEYLKNKDSSQQE